MTKLEELARIANEENQLGNKAVTTAVEHYKAAGDALLEIWKQLGYGKKEEWLKANWKDSHRRAYQLMELAKNWEVVIRGRDQNKPLSFSNALKLIRDPNKETDEDPSSNPFDARKVLKSHIVKSINKHIKYWTPEACWYLGKRQGRYLPYESHLDKWMEQMKEDIEPIADVLYGWSVDGFMDGHDVDTTTERIVEHVKDETLTPYQKQALNEYFQSNYDDIAATRWPEYWFGDPDGEEYPTLDILSDDEPPPAL